MSTATTSAPATATDPVTTPSTRGLVEITKVRKSFGATEVLKGVSLTVEPGGVAVIVGPSGSGKSTLLRTINHLEKVDGGFISIDGNLVGYEVRGNRLHELRGKEILKQRTEIGMVFQNFNLFPHLTALENVSEAPVVAQGCSKDEARRRGLELLDLLLALAHGHEHHQIEDRQDHGERQELHEQATTLLRRHFFLSP